MATIQEINNDILEYNRGINKLTLTTRNALINEIKEFDIIETEELLSSIGTTTRKASGEINSVGYRMSLHGIYTEHGVGRGRPVNSVKAKRNARPWFQPTIEKYKEDLYELVADHKAEMVLNAVNI